MPRRRNHPTPDLALSLNNLSIRIGAFSRSEDGLYDNEEATRPTKGWADSGPELHATDISV